MQRARRSAVTRARKLPQVRRARLRRRDTPSPQPRVRGPPRLAPQQLSHPGPGGHGYIRLCLTIPRRTRQIPITAVGERMPGCCQEHGQLPTKDDRPGTSPQRVGGPSARRGAERPGQNAQWLTDLLTRPGRTGETTRDTGDAQPGPCLVSETRRDAGDVGDARRMARTPEVAGSNLAPTTKARGHFSNKEVSSGMSFVNRFASQDAGEYRRAGIWRVVSAVSLVRSPGSGGRQAPGGGRRRREPGRVY
jgi:hypothetical protein